MSGVIQKYAKVLGQLLPPGLAFESVRRHPLLRAIATEFCRIEDRGADLLREMDPRTATELLPDWEQALRIPDICTPENPTIEDRRIQATLKLANTGGISRERYERLAVAFGFEISIKNNPPFQAGRSKAGDEITNNRNLRNVFRSGNKCGQPLRDFSWTFFITATLPASGANHFQAGKSKAGDPIVRFENPLLECNLLKLKPAHAGIIFRFKNEEVA